MLLDVLANVIPIADVPEYLIREYLPGDDCLDYCSTMDLVFTKKYSKQTKHGYITYLDQRYNILHSFKDEPAFLFLTEIKEWWKNGKLHRDKDQPAVIDEYGERYIKNGKMYKWKKANGIVTYWKNGCKHRDNDQPAVIYPDGTKEWWIHGEKVHKYNTRSKKRKVCNT